MHYTERVKFHDYNGTEIEITPSGIFCATVNDVHLSRPTLELLKLSIEVELKSAAKQTKFALACYAVCHLDDGSYEVESRTLEGLNRNTSALKWEGQNDTEVLFAVPASAENLDLLREYVGAREMLDRVEAALRNRKLESSRHGGRIQASEYAQRIRGLQARYNNAAKGAE